MRNTIQFTLIIGLLLMIITSCNTSKPENKFAEHVFVGWELQSNFIPKDGQCRAVFTFENKSDSIFKFTNWKMYFNQVTLQILPSPNSENGVVEHVNGDLYRFIPSSKFELKPNQKISIPYEMDGSIISDNSAPSGLYFVIDENTKDQQIVLVKNYKQMPFVRNEQVNRSKDDLIPEATPEFCYNRNLNITPILQEQIKRIIPSPVSFFEGKGKFQFSTNMKIVYEKDLVNEASYLQSVLSKVLNTKIQISVGNSAGKGDILLKLSTPKINGVEKEAYQLKVLEQNGITIEGSDAAGVFYGIQSLMALLPFDVFKNPQTLFEIAEINVNDAPRFGYRGIMIDVARHFHSKESVLRLIDLFAYYKLNFLQLLLSDDEGWRIEIPGLPELTEVGSKRGHVGDGFDFLQPNFGIGPFTEAADAYGNGFFSRNDFIEILKYAQTRHITVVPEFCIPGHARAAIKSMEFRYHKLMKAGKESEALEYRLIDVNDTSKYSSAQLYNDNVVCIGQESVYHFYEKVVDEIQALYTEAGVPFKYFHTGGDEVPQGAWLGSPLCKKLVDDNKNGGTLNLQASFFKRIVKIMEKYKVNICGWEEIALIKDKSGKVIPNPEFSHHAIPYIWNNLWGSQDLSYKLANAGYKIVMCNVSNFYFDLSCEKHPLEPGLHWGGFVSTKSAFDFSPFDVFKSTHYNGNMGEPFTAKDAANMEKLKPEAYQNILGLQAELWAETVTKPELLDYHLLPKLIAFSESAWAPQRAWESLEPESARQKAVDIDWNIFANSIGLSELKRLDYLWGGFNYRIPPAGAIVKDGILYANTELPGFTIRYTTDNSEPNENSTIYTKPFTINGTIKLKVFNVLNRSGRAIEISKNQ